MSVYAYFGLYLCSDRFCTLTLNQNLHNYARSQERCISLGHSLIVLMWSCVTDRTLKSDYFLASSYSLALSLHCASFESVINNRYVLPM